MEFREFKILFQKHLQQMCNDSDYLYRTDTDKETLWEKYIESFPKGFNNIYRERREYDCQCCKHFIRTYGNIVQIKDNRLISIWDILGLGTPFIEVCTALSEYVKSVEIRDVFLYSQIFGTDSNKQMTEGKILTWDHLYYKFPSKFHCNSGIIGAKLNDLRTSKEVFKRSMEELTLDAGEAILELIEQNSLYRGEEFKSSIVAFIEEKKWYSRLSDELDQDLWCWENGLKSPISRIRNSAIGTLLIDISEGMDLDQAVAKTEIKLAFDAGLENLSEDELKAKIEAL